MNSETAALSTRDLRLKPSRAIHRYASAVAISGGAFLLTYGLRTFVSNNLYDFFQGAVVLTALYAGFGPALAAACISILTLDYFFIPPLHQFQMGVADLARLLIFGFVALVTSSLSARLKVANENLEMSRQKELLDMANHEQRRLGQDLHDGLCQILAGVRLMAEDLHRRLTARSVPESQDVALIESRLGEALAQADAVSRGLYPVELDTNGLTPALEELADKISHIYPVACRFTCREPVAIADSEAANHVYRIAQEAVMNAIKGGKAKNIYIRLVRCAGSVVLLVADNGHGFKPQAARKGMGLKIMNHRARVLNASLKFRSRPGGTVVRCAFDPGRAL